MNDPHIAVLENSNEDFEAIRRAVAAHDPRLSVRRYPSGASVLDALAETEAELPALMFLDLALTAEDGIDVLRSVRADPRGARIPSVVLSARSDDATIAAAYAAGASGYCVKEIDRRAFERRIAVICEYWCACVQPPR